MKPTEQDIKWCVDNAEWLSGLLEKRDGWQENDWYWQPETPEEVYFVQFPEMLDPVVDDDLVLVAIGDRP